MNINTEIVQVIDAIAREKGIAKEEIMLIVEDAIKAAATDKYGSKHDLKVTFNKKNGEILLFQVFEVVDADKVENRFRQISLQDARARDVNINIGDQILNKLPIGLERSKALIAKRVINSNMQRLEKEREYLEFESKVGKIVSGIVKRVEPQAVIIDLNGTEAILKKQDTIRGEVLKVKARVKAYIKSLDRTQTPQVQLSRIEDQMLKGLFALEVPEIHDGTVEIMAVARAPGARAKMAVFSRDINIDAAGCCIGNRATRINSVSQELHGEKIDIVLWDSNLSKFVVNALNPGKLPNPIKPTRITINEDRHIIELVVPDDQKGRVLGSKGQNIRLAAKLVGWELRVNTETEESAKQLKDFESTTDILTKALEVEEMIAELLILHGFNSIEQIASASLADLAAIEGFDEDIAQELQNRAIQAGQILEQNKAEMLQHLENLGVKQEIIEFLPVKLQELVTLAEHGIKSLEDLAAINVATFKKFLPNVTWDDEQVQGYIEIASKNSRED